MSCGEPNWWADEKPTSKDYVDTNLVELEHAAQLNPTDFVIGTSVPVCNLHLSADDGIVWQTPDGDVNVTDEIAKLREEVNMLKSFIDDMMGSYQVKEFMLNGISIVSEGGYPIQDSEEDKYERAMKGI